jgi:hypothetical protein
MSDGRPKANPRSAAQSGVPSRTAHQRREARASKEIYWSLIEHRIRRPNGKEWSLGTLKTYFTEEQNRVFLRSFRAGRGTFRAGTSNRRWCC